MYFALATFDQDGSMAPALVCLACAANNPDPAYDAVLLSDDDEFCCDTCFTSVAEYTSYSNSAYTVARAVSMAKGN